MELKDKFTGLQKASVIAFEEGLRLGKALDFYIDKPAKRLQGISFEIGLWGTGKESFVDMAEILKIGRDVVIVSRQSAVKPLNREVAEDSLRKLRGFKVATDQGAYVGALVDLNVHPEDGIITEIYLSGNRVLEVDIHEIALGPDVIILPEAYITRIKQLDREKAGLLMRMLGPSIFYEPFREKYDEFKKNVIQGKKTEKVFESLKSSSDKTRQTILRTSQKLQETLDLMRQRRERQKKPVKEDVSGDQGFEAEYAGKTYYEPSDKAPGPEYQGPEADYSGDSGFSETDENVK